MPRRHLGRCLAALGLCLALVPAVAAQAAEAWLFDNGTCSASVTLRADGTEDIALTATDDEIVCPGIALAPYQNSGRLTAQLGEVIVLFSREAFGGMALEQGELELRLEQTSAQALGLEGSAEGYHLTLSLDGQAVSQLAGEMTVAFPAGGHGRKAGAWFLGADGTPVALDCDWDGSAGMVIVTHRQPGIFLFGSVTMAPEAGGSLPSVPLAVVALGVGAILAVAVVARYRRL